MFLCVVARPRYDTNKNAWFDGKIGIWPIGKWEPAKRKSKKQAKGTPVWKNQLINRDVYHEYLIQKLLPAVKEKWPRNNTRIRLQQDGAKSHILEDDVEFKEAVQQIGLNLTVFTQAPNLPDTNLLDLGFFRAIQSFNDECPDNEEELIKSVEKANGEYPWCKLNFVWLTLQSCFNKIIEHNGGNDYKIPHMGKESLWRRGRLPEVLHVTPAANAWLNPTMDDDSDQDSDDSGDEMLFTYVYSYIYGCNGWRRRRKRTYRWNYNYRCLILFRQNTHPAHVTMGRVGATAIRSTHRCRWFLFYCCCFFVSFDCCVSLLFSFHP